MGRFKPNRAGYAALMGSPQVQTVIEGKAGAVKAAADSALSDGGYRYEGHEVKVCARLEHGGEPSCCGTLERLLEKQVAAGIAGQPQLGKHRQLHAVCRCALHGGDGLLRVERTVGHAQRG